MVDTREYVKIILMNPEIPASSRRYTPKPIDIGLLGQWFDMGPIEGTERSLVTVLS